MRIAERVLTAFGDQGEVFNYINRYLPHNEPSIGTFVNAFLTICGVVAVVMIIVGGFKYTTSAGDPGAVTKAKNTLIGAIVGLVIVVLAYVIVNFVIGVF